MNFQTERAQDVLKTVNIKDFQLNTSFCDFKIPRMKKQIQTPCNKEKLGHLQRNKHQIGISLHTTHTTNCG